jgi:hypothetical protein
VVPCPFRWYFASSSPNILRCELLIFVHQNLLTESHGANCSFTCLRFNAVNHRWLGFWSHQASSFPFQWKIGMRAKLSVACWYAQTNKSTRPCRIQAICLHIDNYSACQKQEERTPNARHWENCETELRYLVFTNWYWPPIVEGATSLSFPPCAHYATTQCT